MYIINYLSVHIIIFFNKVCGVIIKNMNILTLIKSRTDGSQDGAEDGSRVACSGKTLQFFVCFISFFCCFTC